MTPPLRAHTIDTEFPRAILHVDGDAFFASCEVARRPELTGKPVVVGAERGIATAFTYEAKALGIMRGMPIARVRRFFPDAVILPGDYALYTDMSARMMNVIRRYTPDIEPYSIDECFTDITGFHVPCKLSYDAMVRMMKKELQSELGMTFSFGLAPTKALAKVASKFAKPDGCTTIPLSAIKETLAHVPIEKVWGIGRKTSARLREDGIATALAFIRKPEHWVAAHYAKPYVALWHELRGESLWDIRSGERGPQKSFMHTRTFTPPSRDRARLVRELAYHTECVCRSAREEGLAARQFAFFLKTQRFKYLDAHAKLLSATNVPADIIPIIEERVDDVAREGASYRATGVILYDLIPEEATTQNLFDTSKRSERLRSVYQKVDAINERYGRALVKLAASGVRKKAALRQKTKRKDGSGKPGRHTKGMPFVPRD